MQTENNNKDKKRGGGQKAHQTTVTNIPVRNESDKLMTSHYVLVF